MPYKVLCTGTFETGKSTLLDRFEDDPAVVVVREVAQDLLEDDPLLELRPEFQDMVFGEQLRREEIAVNSGKPVVLCDRGTLDIVAYCEVLGHQVKPEWEANIVGRYDIAAIFSMEDTPLLSGQYELLDIDIDMYRKKVDTKIREVVSRYRLRKLEVKGTPEEREYFLRRHLRAYL